MLYEVVTPCGRWVEWENSNVRGSPATHLIGSEGNGNTLCGRNPDGWMTQTKGFVTAEYVMKHYDTTLCIPCYRIFGRQQIDK